MSASENGHTGGAWVRHDAADYAEIHPASGKHGSAIALVGRAEDADLIAAAPEMLEAGGAQTDILRKAQGILTQYLMGQPKGLGQADAITALLGLLDDPEQREAQAKWEAAIAHAEGRRP